MGMGYKVVAVVDDKLLSANCPRLHAAASVEYKPQEWTEGRYGPLFIFGSASAAHEYAGTRPDLQVWRCNYEADPRVDPRLIWSVTNAVTARAIRAFWKAARAATRRRSYLDDWGLRKPDGTYFAKRVMLTQRIR